MLSSFLIAASARRRLARATTGMGSGEGADARAFPFPLLVVVFPLVTEAGFALAALAGWTRVRTRASEGLAGTVGADGARGAATVGPLG
ncbi:hypothetical protein DFH11DRAFT_1612500 [Phellopilus nigrolimitatus]|nr:hypothetical protein DFH11DRAFT_1612500 [Phellopilus nigrolimitatus]